MKKIIALLLAVVMVFALVACASTAKTEEKTDAPAPAETNNEQTTEPAEETAAPAEEETAASRKPPRLWVSAKATSSGNTPSPKTRAAMTPALTVSTRAARSSSPTPTAISPSAFWQLRNIPMCSSSR